MSEAERVAAERSRELLVAGLALEHDLGSLRAIAAALHAYRANSARESRPFEEFLADYLAFTPEARHVLAAAAAERLAAFDGDPERALSVDPRQRSLYLSIHASAGPRPTGVKGADADPEKLRVVGPDRFGEPTLAGEGGMGLVYMVRDNELRRFVALKAIRVPDEEGRPIRPSPESPFEQRRPRAGTAGAEQYEELRRRFLNEARITGELEHPGIVPVYELGRTEAGVHVYTMKFVSTHRTLDREIDRYGGEPVSKRIALLEPFLKVCDAMEYAHNQGVLHRDLKPSNIALGEFGEVLTFDWGLAKRLADGPDTGEPLAPAEPDGGWTPEQGSGGGARTLPKAIGTPGWMSPEAASGQLDRMRAQSDVYALGAILYEILTGRLPHAARSMHEMLLKTIEEDAKAPIELNAEIPAELSAIAREAVDRDPRRRPADAGVLASRIRAWQVAERETRERKRISGELRSALEDARASRAGERQRHVERAALRWQQLQDRGGAQHDEVGLGAEIERLRVRARRESLWRMARVPLAAAALIAIALAAGTLWLAWRDTETLLEAADRVLGQSMPAQARQEARRALDRVQAARRGFMPSGVLDRQAEHAHRTIMDAHLMEGDVAGLARHAAALLVERSGGDHHYRSLVAEAFESLGRFEVVRALLAGWPGRTAADHRRLIAAHLHLAEHDAALRVARESGDATAVQLIERYAPLARVVLQGATVMLPMDVGGAAHLLFATSEGHIHLWRPGDTAPRRLAWPMQLKEPQLSVEGRGRFRIYGTQVAEDGGHSGLVIVECDVATEQNRVLDRSTESLPRAASLDLDGDGQLESVLAFASLSRGLQVLAPDGSRWSSQRLGDLAALRTDAQPHANVDLFACRAYPGPLGSRLLAVGSGAWNQGRYGFGISQFQLGPEPGSIRHVRTERMGGVVSFPYEDLDGDGTPEAYLCNSYSPRLEYRSLLPQLAPQGVYAFSPHTLERTGTVLAHGLGTGFFHSAAGTVETADLGWRYMTVGAIDLPIGRRALAICAHQEERKGRPQRANVELAFVEGRGYRALPLCRPTYEVDRTAFGVMDVLPAIPGNEIVLMSRNGVLEILGQGPAVATAPSPVPADEPAHWLLLRGLREAGYPALAADLHVDDDLARGERVAPAERWRRVLALRLEAGQVGQAQETLAQVRRSELLPRFEQLLWAGRIALRKFDPRLALGIYRQVRSDLADSAPHRAAGTSTPPAVATAMEEEVAAVTAALERGMDSDRSWRFGAAAGTADGMPADWCPNHPMLVPESGQEDGLELSLSGQRPYEAATGVTLPEHQNVSIWARLRIDEQPYGSQLCFALTPIPPHELLPPDPQGDAIMVNLERVDSTPRGAEVRARIGGEEAFGRKSDDGLYHWPWGRALRVRIDMAQRVGERGCRIRLLCLDDLTEEVLFELETVTSRCLRPGKYRLGLWGTSRGNPWNRWTRVRVLEVGIAARGDAPLEFGVPEPVPGATDPEGLVRAAWSRWSSGARDQAIAMLRSAWPEPAELALRLVGPRARPPTGLVADCLAAIPELEAALFAEGRGMTSALITADPELLAGLHASGALRAADGPQRRMEIASAYNQLGRLREAWDLLATLSAEDGGRSRLKGLLESAVASYRSYRDDHEADIADPKDRVDVLEAVIRGALIVGDEVVAGEALTVLRELVPAQALLDDPAIRILTGRRR